ncbi:MAG TPA: hypothetical protein VEA44_13885 [Caulobacter sp.]|nr:hypothetical protein [Caulobacter sp.]
MLQRLFPGRIDNGYGGQAAALWLLGLLAVVKALMGGNSIVNARSVAAGADGLVLDRYGGGGAEAVILLFSLTGLAGLVLALQAALVLVRYRAAVPLMYLMLLVEWGARRAIILAHPIERSTDGAGYINLGLLAVMILGFTLSMVGKRYADPAADRP